MSSSYNLDINDLSLHDIDNLPVISVNTRAEDVNDYLVDDVAAAIDDDVNWRDNLDSNNYYYVRAQNPNDAGINHILGVERRITYIGRPDDITFYPSINNTNSGNLTPDPTTKRQRTSGGKKSRKTLKGRKGKNTRKLQKNSKTRKKRKH